MKNIVKFINLDHPSWTQAFWWMVIALLGGSKMLSENPDSAIWNICLGYITVITLFFILTREFDISRMKKTITLQEKVIKGQDETISGLTFQVLGVKHNDEGNN